MTASDGVGRPAEAPVEVVDEVRRRLVGRGSDGRTVEVLAARRGTMMRPGGTVGAGSTDGVVGTLVGLVVSVLLDAVVDVAADGRPWKVKAYRRRRLVIQRLHQEILPPGVQPEERMRQLLDRFLT